MAERKRRRPTQALGDALRLQRRGQRLTQEETWTRFEGAMMRLHPDYYGSPDKLCPVDEQVHHRPADGRKWIAWVESGEPTHLEAEVFDGLMAALSCTEEQKTQLAARMGQHRLVINSAAAPEEQRVARIAQDLLMDVAKTAYEPLVSQLLNRRGDCAGAELTDNDVYIALVGALMNRLKRPPR